jgi:opacity protein-like surface antigen
MSLKSRFLASCVATLAINTGTQATAADYDPPIFIEEAPEWVPVEIGSGWYLRGDVNYAFKKSYKDTRISVDDSLFDNNYLGLGEIGPVDFFGAEEKRWPVTGSVGVGYRFSDYIRGDLNIGYLGSDRHSGSAHLSAGYLQPYSVVNAMDPSLFNVPDFGCLGSREVTATVQPLDGTGNPSGPAQVNTVNNADWRMDCMIYGIAERSAWNGMANGYVDLGTIAGFTPYVGAGIGLLYTSTRLHGSGDCQNRRSQEITTTSSEITTIEVDFACRGGEGRHEAGSYSKTDYNLMYSLSAGVAYQVAENTKLDLGYQYLSAPSVRHYALTDNGVELRRGVSEHQIKVGLRYELW